LHKLKQEGNKFVFEVVYFSKGGNTKKVAQAIASELDVEAKDIQTLPAMPEDSFVFLGTGNYGGKPVKPIVEFIERNSQQLRRIGLFGTSASGTGTEISKIEKLLAQKGITVTGKFYCKGKFLFLRRHNPTDEELQQARVFAAKFVNIPT
jgi:flavodoxin